MRVKVWRVLLIVLFFALSRSAIALNPIDEGDVDDIKFILVQNDIDDNFFVTPLVPAVNVPVMAGANRWTGLKYNFTTVNIYQDSLGYVENGVTTPILMGMRVDMWIDNPPASGPLIGIRCVNYRLGCNASTSLLLPEATDNYGFYGVTIPLGPAKYMNGMMSDAFYYYLNGIPVGGHIQFMLNDCSTSEQYDARAGQRCREMNTGDWHKRNLGFIKAGHLKLPSTVDATEVFIDSDGNPMLGEGSSGCNLQVVGGLSGLSCKMTQYMLTHDNGSNTTIHIYPSLNHPALASAINGSKEDMQFSLDGQTWKVVDEAINYFTYDDLKSTNVIYVFLSTNFFKKMVDLGISDTNTHELFNFRVHNSSAVENGWYEFSTSRQLIIKPRDYSISIISTDYVSNPTRSGKVGPGKPSLDFDYIVTTSGSDRANEVLINVTGPSQNIQGRAWCIFSSADGTSQVPFPGTLSFTTASGSIKSYDVGCDGQWRDMTEALWASPRLIDPSNSRSVFNKATVRFSIGMDAPESLKTINDDDWYGDVSAAGEIHVQATWRNIR